jgi:hypothetical protein
MPTTAFSPVRYELEREVRRVCGILQHVGTARQRTAIDARQAPSSTSTNACSAKGTADSDLQAEHGDRPAVAPVDLAGTGSLGCADANRGRHLAGDARLAILTARVSVHCPHSQEQRA